MSELDNITASGREAGLKYVDADIIYTMPKRFLNSAKKKKESKGFPWLLILALSALLLVGIFAGFYAFLSRHQPSASPAESAVPAAIDAPGGRPDEQPALTPGPGPDETAPVDASPAAPAEAPADSSTASPTPEAAPVTVEIGGEGTAAEMVTDAAKSATKPAEPATDRDGDGLSDLEESLLDTNADSNDSDLDGYSDKDELLNLYNPAAGGQLDASPNIRKYRSASQGYSLLYPLAWGPESPAGGDSTIFRLPNNQFVQVLALDNAKGQILEEWYKEQFEAAYIDPQQQYFKAGWKAMKSADGLNYYLASPQSDKVFTLAYNTGLDAVAAYLKVFEMMVRSFALGV